MKVHPLENLNIWRKSLVGQLLVRFWICHIIFFSMIGFIQYNSIKNSLYQSVEQNLLSDYFSIKNNMPGWILNDELPPGRFAELRPGNFVAFYTSDYTLKSIVYSYGQQSSIPNLNSSGLPFDLAEKARTGECFTYEDDKKVNYMFLATTILNTPTSLNSLQMEKPATAPAYAGYALIGEPLTQEEAILNKNLRSFVFNAIIIILLSTFLTALALQKPLEPLLIISSTARKIANGRYDLRLPTMSNAASEILQLRETLNHMLGQMENALKTERSAKNRMARFIADASHELRTPLTSIRGFLEILQRTGTTDKETLETAHQTMLIETERLIRLTEGLLTLNRITQEESTDGLVRYTSSLGDILPELLPLLTPLLHDRILMLNGKDIVTLAEDDLKSPDSEQLLPLKPDELKQILYNLINNAIQHTSAGGIISIDTGMDKGRLHLSIKDNGEGIVPEDIPHIFERFFRSDRSRTHEKGQGSGLGLAIVSELVRHRGGDIHVESQRGEGTCFRISFPVMTGLRQ
ncbi:HAMP domain-containing histidine kinase [Dehalobacter sp. DCM]|uniref:sensor histidine kinase n=1 Tax=Dehalobacter sp. DCM TaxID=2907827 RepID=UPI003081DDDB|nr:HAMP domain-containing histidine kinase [Dehalobacter sp. DCM]